MGIGVPVRPHATHYFFHAFQCASDSVSLVASPVEFHQCQFTWFAIFCVFIKDPIPGIVKLL